MQTLPEYIFVTTRPDGSYVSGQTECDYCVTVNGPDTNPLLCVGIDDIQDVNNIQKGDFEELNAILTQNGHPPIGDSEDTCTLDWSTFESDQETDYDEIIQALHISTAGDIHDFFYIRDTAEDDMQTAKLIVCQIERWDMGEFENVRIYEGEDKKDAAMNAFSQIYPQSWSESELTLMQYFPWEKWLDEMSYVDTDDPIVLSGTEYYYSSEGF